ncbi:MAG: flap endonuclease-1, partial [Methermicoccaceae archaeon]
VKPELIFLEKELVRLGITHEQLVDISLLVGTDFNSGIKGIGPKKALAWIKKEGNIYQVLEKLGEDIPMLEDIREFMLSPNVSDSYTME